MKKTILAALVATAFAISVGMEALYAAPRKAGHAGSRGSDLQGAQGSSSQQGGQVASNLKNTHAYREYLKGEDIQVEEKNGVLTLKGTVSDDSKKALAEETALRCPGWKRWRTGWR